MREGIDNNFSHRLDRVVALIGGFSDRCAIPRVWQTHDVTPCYKNIITAPFFLLSTFSQLERKKVGAPKCTKSHKCVLDEGISK